MKMEEIFENFKSFVEERKNLQEQINQVERKRNELAEERNAKKAINKINNDEELCSEINCLGRQISDLGNQSQWFQNQIDEKLIEIKKQAYLEIDSLVAEEMRKIRIINEQIEENENCSDDVNTIYDGKNAIQKIQESISDFLWIKKTIKYGEIYKIIENNSETNQTTNIEEESEKIETTTNIIEESELEEVKLEVEPFTVEKIEPQIEETKIDEFKVDEFNPQIEEIKVDEFKVDEFNPQIDEVKVEELNVEEFKPQIENIEIEGLNEKNYEEQEEEPKIENLILEEFENIIKENTQKQTQENIQNVQEENKSTKTLDTKDDEYEGIEDEIIRTLQEQLAKEKEIITYEEKENKTKLEEKTRITVDVKLQSINIKIEDRTIVYKVQYSDGTSINIYPIKEKLFSNEKEIRKQFKEILEKYVMSTYKNFYNYTIRKMDPVVCEIINQFAKRFNKNAPKMLYSYVMSFSSQNVNIEELPKIIYNLSYINEAEISKNDLKTMQKIVKNASKNVLIDTIGTVTFTEKMRYFVKRLLNLNNIKALSEGNKENL